MRGAGPIYSQYLGNFGKNFLEKYTSFATMNDPPVQATTHYTLLTIYYTPNTAHPTLHLGHLPAAVALDIVMP